ncbi:MAG: hypothetical protein DI603_19945 [Roseateles depolymerans]|uniref:histidine kinase n=1 Tax=Roseateles depolymerans TaxID=76731 RepID=A0A2W5D8U9_9BURK|nr:MAG: hypothetical protein DI603_19945 [Roseateles depolymerans]
METRRPDLLIVGDDVTVVRQLQTFVQDMVALRVARSGEDALRLCRQTAPDLVLLDLHLQGPDGLQTLAALRAEPGLAHLPVILMSAEATPEMQVRALELDVTGWLSKPLGEELVRSRVRAALRQPQAVAGGPAVLAVDDDANALAALRRTLQAEGISFVGVETGEEALRLVDQAVPDLVLLDVALPGADGFELARRLQTRPGMAEVPIIFVTQYGDVASEVRALELGAFDFVSKPFPEAVLRARVRHALRLRQRNAEAMQRAQERWRRISDAQLSTLVAQAHEAILSLDGQGRIVLANAAARQLLGLPEGEVIGATLPDWLRAALPADLLDGSEPLAVGIELQPPGQALLSMDVSMSRQPGGAQGLRTLVLFDQTPRLQAEQQARERVKLEAEGRAKQMMMSYLAHEIGNPLNGVLGMAEVLLAPGAEPLTASQSKRLQLILDNGMLLRRLLQDALDLARWESGHFEVKPAAVPLGPLVAACMEAQQTQAEQAGVRLEPASGDLDATALADAARLQQCLYNLIGNACKYGKRGGRVQVDVRRRDQGIEIGVADDGIGLSPEQVEKLFEPFQRLGRSGPPGHGLGLAVSRMLVRAMQGELTVQSQSGVGSRFVIALPRA